MGQERTQQPGTKKEADPLVLSDLKPPETGKALLKKIAAMQKMKEDHDDLICCCGDPACKIGPFTRTR